MKEWGLGFRSLGLRICRDYYDARIRCLSLFKAEAYKFFSKRVAQQAGQSVFKAGGSDVFRIAKELGD